MKKSAFIALGLVTALIVVVASFPAGTAWHFVEQEVEASIPALQVTRIDGSLWRGSAQADLGALPPLLLRWQLRLLPLLAGTADADLTITGNGARSNLRILASSSAQQVSGNAVVHSRYINRVSVNYGLETSAEFVLSDLDLKIEGGRPVAVTGRIDWQGGIVHLETGGRVVTRKSPPLLADIGLEGSNILMKISAAENRLMLIRIKPDGWAEVTILNALIRTLNLPFPGGPNIDGSAPALVFEEKLL